MIRKIISTGLAIFIFGQVNVFAQSDDEIKLAATKFPAMPESAVQLKPYKQASEPIVVTAGSPTNDLEWTVFDSDYVDGETNGYDTYCPVDPSADFPGSSQVRIIECVSKLHTDSLYGGARGDRIILGVEEIEYPFFSRGQDSIDNDFVVIRHFDFRNGHIQLRGKPDDYRLKYYDKMNDGVKTNGWYLFYTANGNIDLIAFIYACDDVTKDNQPEFANTLCNEDKSLSLANPKQFIYAKPVSKTPSIPDGLAQIGNKGKEVVSGSTTDYLGNIYIFGLTDSNFDSKEKVSNEIFVSKTNPKGELIWVAEMPSAEGTLIFDAVTDSQFVYAARRTNGNLPGFTNKGRWDGIILKIEINTGTIVDFVQFGTSVIDGFGNITIDDNHHLYVSGAGAPIGTNSPGDNAFLIAKYNCKNLQQIWLVTDPVTPGSTKAAEAWGGISYLPGNYPGGGKLLTGGWFVSATLGGADGYLTTYNNLDKAHPTRENTFVVNSPGFKADWVWGSTFDKDGNVYAVGYTTGNLNGTQKGEGDAFVLKLDKNLSNPVYRQVGTAKSERLRKVKVDDDGFVYVSGYTYGNLNRDNPDKDYFTADIIVQKYTSDLTLLKSVQIGTPYEERGFLSLTKDRICIGGMTEGSMVTANRGSFDGFVVALATSNLSVIMPPLSSKANVANRDQSPFRIYPNPVNSILSISSSTNMPFQYKVYDISGSLVTSGWSPSEIIKLDVSSLNKGIYFIEVTIDTKQLNYKFIKQ